MEDFSEENIKANCPHCNTSSHAFKYLLEETDDFYAVCDPNPIVEGHLLIIPKKHISCIGAYDAQLYDKFIELHKKAMEFVRASYGSAAFFEHGVFGQTVFHSHIHYMPFAGKPEDIVPEGADKLRTLADMSGLKDLLKRDDGYLLFGIGDSMWTVDPSLAAPRFFRDRFAKALNVPERGNWKAMRQDPAVMQVATELCDKTLQKWGAYHHNENH